MASYTFTSPKLRTFDEVARIDQIVWSVGEGGRKIMTILPPAAKPVEEGNRAVRRRRKAMERRGR